MDKLSKYFRILELEPGATFDQIKQSYRVLVQVWHPDRFVQNPALKVKAEGKLKQINEAYEVLVVTFSSMTSKEINIGANCKNGDTSRQRADWPSIHTRELFDVLLDEKLTELETLLAKGANVNSVADDRVVKLNPGMISSGDSLLHLACCLGNKDATVLLLRYGAEINAESEDGITPLQLAISPVRSMDATTPLQVPITIDGIVAKFLVQQGADINVKDGYGLSPLHYARPYDLIEILISKGANVNDVDEYYGYTPLHYAALYNELEKTRLLLAAGANIQARGKCGESPLHLAGAKFGLSILWDRLSWGEAIANFLVEQGAELEARDLDGATPLHWAMGAGVGKVDDPNGPYGWFGGGHKTAIEFLIKKGANINAKDNQGITPLQLAKRRGNKELVKLLHKYGARETLLNKLRKSASAVGFGFLVLVGVVVYLAFAVNDFVRVAGPGDKEGVGIVVDWVGGMFRSANFKRFETCNTFSRKAVDILVYHGDNIIKYSPEMLNEKDKAIQYLHRAIDAAGNIEDHYLKASHPLFPKEFRKYKESLELLLRYAETNDLQCFRDAVPLYNGYFAFIDKYKGEFKRIK